MLVNIHCRWVNKWGNDLFLCFVYLYLLKRASLSNFVPLHFFSFSFYLASVCQRRTTRWFCSSFWDSRRRHPARTPFRRGCQSRGFAWFGAEVRAISWPSPRPTLFCGSRKRGDSWFHQHQVHLSQVFWRDCDSWGLRGESAPRLKEIWAAKVGPSKYSNTTGPCCWSSTAECPSTFRRVERQVGTNQLICHVQPFSTFLEPNRLVTRRSSSPAYYSSHQLLRVQSRWEEHDRPCQTLYCPVSDP